ncbi:MAG TPA: hypothetical protein PK129_18500 [Cellvibrionaceae bacterium]|nr:hypothetical protein [Cellvibrionaceae bacterium]
MRLGSWHALFFALVMLIFVGQSAVAAVAICPMQAQSQASHSAPPCHQASNPAPQQPTHKHPMQADCCHQLGHCLLQAAALINMELTSLPAASRVSALYGYQRTAPHPQDYPLFRPPIPAHAEPIT